MLRNACGRSYETETSTVGNSARQVPIDSFIVDFCCIEARLIVELDGGQHAGEKKCYDDLRTRQLKGLGFRVLRFWNSEVLQEIEGFIQEIGRMLRAE
jgi:very-short-patch-repair endonuclease